jgi:hypothetical protein
VSSPDRGVFAAQLHRSRLRHDRFLGLVQYLGLNEISFLARVACKGPREALLPPRGRTLFWETYAAETEARLARLAEELAAAQAAAENAPAAEHQARIERAVQADLQLELDEAATRRLIDEKLRLRGWHVDSDHLTHASRGRSATHPDERCFNHLISVRCVWRLPGTLSRGHRSETKTSQRHSQKV